VTALKACGVSVQRIIRPGIVFGLVMSLFSFVFKDQVEMPANMNYLLLYAKIISQKPAVELMENQFIQLGNFKINFARMEQNAGQHILYDIHLVDIAGRKTVEAEKGRIFTDPDDPSHYTLKLANGSLSEVMTSDGEEHFFVSTFKYLAINRMVDLPQEFTSKSPESMNYIELMQDIGKKSEEILKTIDTLEADKTRLLKELDTLKQRFAAETAGMDGTALDAKKKEYAFKAEAVEGSIAQTDKTIESFRKGLPLSYMRIYHEKFSMPLASLFFALISLCYGLFNVRTGRNEGLGISLIIIVVYFGFKMLMGSLADTGTVPAAAVWLPNIVFFFVGIGMFVRKVRE